MASFQNWSNVQRLDAITPHNNEVSLYHGNQLALTVGKGVTFGFLKLLYSAETSNNNSTLLGIKPRGDLSQRIISSENALLDRDEYELITDYTPSVVKPSSAESVMPFFSSRHIQHIQQFLTQYQFNSTPNQRSLPQMPLSINVLPPFSCYQEPVVSTMEHSLLALSQTVTSTSAHIPLIPELPEVTNLQTEGYNLQESENNLQETRKSGGLHALNNECASQQNIDDQAEAREKDYPNLRNDVKAANNNSIKGNENSFVDTGKFPFQCEVCHVPFKSKAKFDYHKRRHTEDKPHMCSYCGEAFKFFHELSKHRDEQHLCNKTFKCEQCTKSFSSRKELKRHLWRHTGKKTHKCELCGKEYTSAGNLSLHRQKHTGVKPLKCSLCPRMFRHKTVLENHIRMSHTGDRPFSCSYCNKTFPTHSQLSSHKKRHSDEKPYKCTECGKAFRQGHILKRHSLVHTNEKPYKCHVCGKSFRELSNLQYHKRTHLDKSHRSVVCPLCGKSIIAGRGIKRHLKLYHNKICVNENDARTLLKSLQPAEKSSEDVSPKQSQASVDQGAFITDAGPISITSQPANERIPSEQVLPTRSFDFSENGNLSTAENNKSLKNIAKTDNARTEDKEAKTVNRNITKPGLIKKNSTKEAKFCCNICLKAFRGPKTLTNHMKIAHGDCRVLVLNGLPRSNGFKCKECHLFFSSKISLDSHIDLVHSCIGAEKPDVAKGDKVKGNLTEGQVIEESQIEQNIARIESHLGEAVMKNTGKEIMEENNSELEETEAGVAKGNMQKLNLMPVNVTGSDAIEKQRTRPCGRQESEPQLNVSQIDGTLVDMDGVDVTQAGIRKSKASYLDDQSDTLQSNLMDASGPDMGATQLPDIDLSEPHLALPDLTRNCDSKDSHRTTTLERGLALLTGDAKLTEMNESNEVTTDTVCSRPRYEGEASFQVIYSFVSKERNRKSISQNEVEQESYLSNVLKNEMEPLCSINAASSRSNERNSNRLQELAIARFDNNSLHFLKNVGDKTINEVDECIYKGTKIKILGSDVLANQPPQGYSFGFLPILVENEYSNQN